MKLIIFIFYMFIVFWILKDLKIEKLFIKRNLAKIYALTLILCVTFAGFLTKITFDLLNLLAF